MLLPIAALVFGMIILIWSADRFVEGSASTASYFGMPPLLIGMVIVGFGTSTPEMLVSALSAYQGNPGIALGNAYGSNIVNISLILGVTALINPIRVNSRVLRKELPVLTVITAVAIFQLLDYTLSFTDSVVLLVIFSFLMFWSIRQGIKQKEDTFAQEMKNEIKASHTMPIKTAFFWVILGLVFLIISSRMLVWGAVEISALLGISDMIVGLTVVAIGTSLPELASSVMATRKGEHDIALGNVLGSNLFNTLAVVGIAGVIKPLQISPETLYRDMTVMGGLTVSLFIIGYGFKGQQGRINRIEGMILLIVYVLYTVFLITHATST